MGAGAKADPSRIQIADISETFGKASKICVYYAM
jgi:tRNA A37 threonylcarbamoyladenosine dehydratase